MASPEVEERERIGSNRSGDGESGGANQQGNTIKYSRRIDSDGVLLTEAQAEYFQDSKVRDENGSGTDSEDRFSCGRKLKKNYKKLFVKGKSGLYITNSKFFGACKRKKLFSALTKRGKRVIICAYEKIIRGIL